uniref:Uncharacterized protein n=1 Tax=Coccidioides posadasii RMSCC 3488 TaxID=454284 RepID=A0A0J6ICH8_COCPO|nr:hypothetical protein CPAG_05703 [Coccidioides posadasii RMSCC 3488]
MSSLDANEGSKWKGDRQARDDMCTGASPPPPQRKGCGSPALALALIHSLSGPADLRPETGHQDANGKARRPTLTLGEGKLADITLFLDSVHHKSQPNGTLVGEITSISAPTSICRIHIHPLQEHLITCGPSGSAYADKPAYLTGAPCKRLAE